MCIENQGSCPLTWVDSHKGGRLAQDKATSTVLALRPFLRKGYTHHYDLSSDLRVYLSYSKLVQLKRQTVNIHESGKQNHAYNPTIMKVKHKFKNVA